MTSKISSKIFATTCPHFNTINVVQDSQIPIELQLEDYDLPAGAKVIAFARGKYANKTYTANCAFSGNTITLIPPAGFFVPGHNAMQLEVNGNIIPFAICVYCAERVSGIGEPTSPEPVRPLVERAEAAAKQSEDAASAANSSASAAGSSAGAAAKSEGNAKKSETEAAKQAKAAADSASAAAGAASRANASAQAAANVAVRTPYIGTNGHWYVWDINKGAFIDSGAVARGPVGPIGPAPAFDHYAVAYQVSSSGTVVPTGAWQASIPQPPQGQYLWTRVTARWEESEDIVWYSVSYRAIDGEQSVASEVGLRVVDGVLCAVFNG